MPQSAAQQAKRYKPILKVEDIQNLSTIKPSSKPSTLNFWDSNYDLDNILDLPCILPPSKPSTPTTNPPDNSGFSVPENISNLELKTYDNSRDPSLIGSHIQDIYDDGLPFALSNLTPLDNRQSMWPMDSIDPMSLVAPQVLDNTSHQQHPNLDFFSFGSLDTTQNKAPASLTRDVPQSQDSEEKEIPKKPKKRGRKRKILDAQTAAEERKKFLERNRVAANRCRERKKSWVSNLEEKKIQLEHQNAALRMQIDELEKEVMDLREIVKIDCGCSIESLVINIREVLKSERGCDIERLVDKLRNCRTESVDESSFCGAEWSMIERKESDANSAGSDAESIFSRKVAVKDESSTQSSPVDGDEGK